eukprot:4985503-Amphidinium_carterae.1
MQHQVAIRCQDPEAVVDKGRVVLAEMPLPMWAPQFYPCVLTLVCCFKALCHPSRTLLVTTWGYLVAESHATLGCRFGSYPRAGAVAVRPTITR